ncbi:MAG: Mfa1 fimbrilin C-terminal domain-containing protein [Bacteroidaceae bacterium]|nr:Mfa1 fimbrilin C-terminal domain-containing protein [Bacteroidaceae bacterium]
MRKRMFFAALCAAGMLLTACSSDNDVENVSTGDNGGNKFIAVGINLPQAPAAATRADGTDNAGEVTYDDGLPTEYSIKNATLIIFSNATKEDDATFVAAYSVSTTPWMGTTSHNVTGYSKKVVQQVGSSVVAGYRALVVLNHNGILEVTANDGLSVNSTALTTSTKFSDFRKMLTTSISTLDAAGMTSAGFFMANAPLSNGSGSTSSLLSGATTTLVPITADAIYKTEADAEAGADYDQIYVERGVAKVTMEQNDGTATMTNSKVAETTPKTLKWQVTGWMLDNTAPSTYLVRSTDGDTDFRALKSNVTGGVYRYIGNTEIYDGANTASGFYRTYFAKSVGYDKWATSETYTLNTYASGDFYSTFGTANPKYCYENTFDVDHQNMINTTLVQLAITAKTGTDAEDLYTFGGQKTDVYTKDLLIAKIQEAAYYVLAGDGVLGTITTADVAVVMPTTSVAGQVELDPDDATKIKVTPAAGKLGTGYNETTFYTNLRSALGAVYCYKGGVSYYNIRIKHFGDVLTPWNTTEYGSNTAPNSTAIYPDNASNRDGDYLGRYGVLRNNWYDISVSSVRSLGDATPHTGTWPDTPDDELDNYLAFRINVLSWAKRTQAAEL